MSRRRVVPAGPDEVWAAVTAPDQLRQWFGADVDLELVAGGSAVFRGHDGQRRRGTILEADAPRRLRFSWWPLGQPLEASTVVVEIAPRPDGSTEVVVTEHRDAPAGGPGARAGAPLVMSA